ncbi:hypothetical protein SBDP1_540048 [Syntrophobacter sp. SbD1]|nr:hypothetical protein SBDP1_540048 [Syntrophobacter sp. SbD1]
MELVLHCLIHQKEVFLMGGPRLVYEFLKASSIAHAQWDYEVSMSIIKNRRKLLFLLLLLAPILVVSLLEAAPLLGGKEAYAPPVRRKRGLRSCVLFADHIFSFNGHRPCCRTDHRVYRGRRRIYHYPRSYGCGCKGHSGCRHRSFSHFCQGHYGHHRPQETRKCFP